MTVLQGKKAIVTGAAMGLGKAYAAALAREGVAVAICDLHDVVHEVADALSSEDATALAWQGDVGDATFVRRMVDEVEAAFGGVDILVNNAGVWRGSRADDDLDKSIDDYHFLVDTNLKGPFLFGRAVIPGMIEGGGGDIVNIATDHMVTCGTPYFRCPKLPTCPWGDSPRPTGGGDGMDLYDASKWGLNGFLYGWAKALAPHGIRVNALCMGATDSHMLRSFHRFDPPQEEVDSWMKAEDNAAALIELLQDGPTGRNAQNHNFCVGRPVALEEPADHLYIIAEQLRGPGR